MFLIEMLGCRTCWSNSSKKYLVSDTFTFSFRLLQNVIHFTNAF